VAAKAIVNARNRHQLVAAALIATGLIHLIPSIGLVGGDVFERLYGVEVVDPVTDLLLRHRAVLFGLLGLGLMVAAFRQHWQRVGLIAGLASTVSFIGLALATPLQTPQITRVVLVDVVAVALLLVGLVLRVRKGSGR
jgi:hypothetical protein